VRGFLKQFAPDQFRPDEISILEDALEDVWRRVEDSKTPWKQPARDIRHRKWIRNEKLCRARGSKQLHLHWADIGHVQGVEQKVSVRFFVVTLTTIAALSSTSSETS
jgi:uncharacterized protein YecE (DUF72 family)